MMMGKMKDSELSEEEKKIRQEEEKLFQQLSAPPTKLEAISDVLCEDKGEDSTSVKKKPKKTK